MVGAFADGGPVVAAILGMAPAVEKSVTASIIKYQARINDLSYKTYEFLRPSSRRPSPWNSDIVSVLTSCLPQ